MIRTDFICLDLHGYSLFSRQQDSANGVQATSDGTIDDRAADVKSAGPRGDWHRSER